MTIIESLGNLNTVNAGSSLATPKQNSNSKISKSHETSNSIPSSNQVMFFSPPPFPDQGASVSCNIL
ncbi:hypothetical protein CYY_005256 [Polysphondylium violaceum]|uniref:Uncharacterized protein n=1 Tax=Polysphondylium violaceum TaxID=133409 RepID=A0A8J4V709_9MYCE|nr:hypothetical protein CYY_005256 [Polysphondylium violaceum]